MPSTYSPSLRLELIDSGEQSGTWGTTTNTNLGTLLEQSIVGVQAITMFDVNYTLSNFNGVSDEARKAVLVVSGTNTVARDIIAPLVAKTYTIKNNTTGGFAINIKAATGSSVSIPNGATSIVYCDGTNFNLAVNQTAVAAGTGISVATVGATNTISIDSTVATLTGTQTLTNKTLTAPNLGTPTTLVGTNITGTAAAFTASNVTTNANLTGGVTSVGNAATVVTNANLTGMVTSVGNAASLGSFTSANLATALTDATGTGANVFATSPTLVTPDLGTPSTLVGTNITGTAASLTAGAVTNGVYTTGTQTIGGSKTFSSTVLLADGGVMFASDGGQDTGISWASDGVMNVRCNASTVGQFNSTGFTGNAATVVTNANLTGGVTSVGNAATVVTNANLTGAIISTGNATILGTASFTSANLATALTDATGTGAAVFGTSPAITSPTLTSPVIAGTPSGVGVLTSAAAQSAPGATASFTGIPSWVKRITVMLANVSSNGTSDFILRIGAGTTPEASGYLGGCVQVSGGTGITSTNSINNGFTITGNTLAANSYSGIISICLQTGSTWVQSGNLSRNDNPLQVSGGSKTITGTLGMVIFTTVNGTDTFDAGSINIMYE